MESWIVNPLDIIIVFVLLMSGVYAFMRGFVREVLGILTWISAFFAAVWGYAALAPSFQGIFPTAPWSADVIAWMIIFLAVLVVLYVASSLTSSLVKKTVLGPLDRSLGFLFGIARGWLIMVAVTLALNWIVAPDKQPQWLHNAVMRPLLDASVRTLLPLLPASVASGSANLARPLDAAADSQRQFQRLLNPQPISPEKKSEDGYSQSKRDSLDRLIEGIP